MSPKQISRTFALLVATRGRCNVLRRVARKVGAESEPIAAPPTDGGADSSGDLDSQVRNAGEAAAIPAERGVSQRNGSRADQEVVRPDLSAARDPRAQASMNARNREVELDHPQGCEKVLDECFPGYPPRLGVGTVHTVEKLRGRDRRQDERLTGVSSAERIKVNLSAFRRDE